MIIPKPNILLVEDNVDDFELTRQGFLRSNYDVHLHHVTNGKMCLEYLTKAGSFHDAVTPDLVLLDLNMPVMDGRELLRHLSQGPTLRQLPVVVLTTSHAKTDVLYAYSMGCNSFVVKPLDIDEFQETINRICAYWFETSLLPPQV